MSTPVMPGAGMPAVTLLAPVMVIRSQLVGPGRTLSCWVGVGRRGDRGTLPAAVLTLTWFAMDRLKPSSSSWMPMLDGRSSVWSKVIWIHWPTGVSGVAFRPGGGGVPVEGVDRVVLRLVGRARNRTTTR